MKNNKYKELITAKISNLENEIKTLRDEKKAERPEITLDSSDFGKIFRLTAKANMLKKGTDKDFIIDENNKHVINQLYFYISNSDKFEGDLNKGILLIGKIGTGKTLIMNTIIDMISMFSNKIFTCKHAIELSKIANSEYIEMNKKKPMFVDDIGKESKQSNDYGTVFSPITDLFAMRYNYGAWTFATSNYTLEKGLTGHYGETITDRFKEMFNVFILKGNSRRV